LSVYPEVAEAQYMEPTVRWAYVEAVRAQYAKVIALLWSVLEARVAIHRKKVNSMVRGAARRGVLDGCGEIGDLG
jgi:hypothetical protein